ncbi:Chitin synthase, class 3 [Malassezia pachydermatis]|uniref:chitin synthase n=1 Tax=Malassezia pachydermatis TaxID=77020 RepID=A0A0M9VR43_9BASI|nr:glycosyltransferase family 2 protein [Malassezia pachydermatis]KOS16212.1 glycosyltransferase family 2 protein [Malassezia pachydermatis]
MSSHLPLPKPSGSGGGGGSFLSRAGSFARRDRDIEAGSATGVQRKKSMVRPERERMDPNHRQWHYRNHAAQMDNTHGSNVAYMPSSTGHMPHHGAAPSGQGFVAGMGPGGGVSGLGLAGHGGPQPQRHPQLRRGKSILGHNEDKVESGIHFLRRGVSMRRTAPGNPDSRLKEGQNDPPPKDGCFDWIAPGPVGPWMIYSWFVTSCITSPCLRMVGIKTPEQQRAWREKMGLISIILVLMAIVGYITFGFTQTVCGVQNRYDLHDIYFGTDAAPSVLMGGKMFTLDKWHHPGFSGDQGYADLTNKSLTPADIAKYGSNYGADLNLIFQQPGGACEGVLKPTQTNPPRYFECAILRTREQYGTTQIFKSNDACHDVSTRTNMINGKPGYPRVMGDAYVKWEDMANYTNHLMFWRSHAIDITILSQKEPLVQLTDFMTKLTRPGPFQTNWTGKDITAQGMRAGLTKELDCLAQLGSIASVDVDSYGCIASQVELILSMIFIIGAVGIKFIMAVVFAWLLSWRIGNYDNESYAQRMKRMNEVETWTDDIYRPAPAGYRPNVKKSFLPTTSRFNQAYQKPQAKPTTLERKIAAARMGHNGTPVGSPPGSPLLTAGRSSMSLTQPMLPSSQSMHSSTSSNESPWGPCPFPLYNVVPQPPSNYQPFNFPLVHAICLVTAYSESFEGLRTTLDSLATTNYPNSHKLLLVIADGIVKGADSDISTPDICLSMMKDLIVSPEEVEGYSYVAIADGTKRHNMAKVYAGFYDYDDHTVERSKQQRVPMILIAKCGTMMEMDSAKPGNRGKRDSQVMLMAFMQKVLFDERMTQFEYEFFNSIWRVTGVTADQYEIVLMVDADTKVFPDSLTRMTAAMVEDPEIMGLCGETKIANKTQSWVTMIQVFEYYISHHQTKGFEACFGGVTCLPGCFSAYRIKAPKGPKGFYVPILANPDIVEHYSENVVDTLHKKNLLLLGEDRYLTTLMLKTFPKRKMMFQPSAVCKTIVPDSFRVLRSQRRRWINSTVHNLLELIQVKDLCGTFCFSMRFVVFMDLVGTLVLPAALAFTLYVVVRAIQIPIANQSKVKEQREEFPLMPLVLLALILGLPGVLIVITSRRFMYVLWLCVYLISLPVWNLILPAYAYWHMDDFSWGATRVVQGEKKGEHHGDADGEFDSSDMIMKRWIEFERERRWRSGMESRDGGDQGSLFSTPNDAPLPQLPPGAGASASNAPEEPRRVGSRARLDSVPLLELPAPLGTDARQRKASPPTNAVGPTSRPPGPAPLGMNPSPSPTPNPNASMAARQHLFGPSPTSAAMRPPPMTGARPPAGMISSPPPRPGMPPDPGSPPGSTPHSPPQSPPIRPMAQPNPWASPPQRPGVPASYAMPGQPPRPPHLMNYPPRPPAPGGAASPPPRPTHLASFGQVRPMASGAMPGRPGMPTSPPMRPVMGPSSPPPRPPSLAGFSAPGRPPMSPPPQGDAASPPMSPGANAIRPSSPPLLGPGQAPLPRAPVRPQVPQGVQRVSLTDDGPVAGSSGSMRQVVRGARRQSSANHGPQLPPFDSSFTTNPFESLDSEYTKK